MLWFLYLCLCLTSCSGYQDDEWIDPTDMLNYDASSGRMRPQKQHPSGNKAENQHAEEQSQGTCQKDGLDSPFPGPVLRNVPVSKNKSCEEHTLPEFLWHSACAHPTPFTAMVTTEKSTGEKGIHQGSCNPVFRRYLHRILNEVQHLGLPGDTQPEVHFDAEIVLTKEMVAEMERFLDNAEWNAGALDEVLTRTLIRFKYHNIEEWGWKLEDFIGIDAFTAFMISLSVLCIIMTIATELWSRVSWFTQIRRLFIILFIISIGWNWMYLYKVAFAERQAEIAKMGQFDATCGKKVTWIESLGDWWRSSAVFQNDPCEEYYKALMISPILLVPPTKALAVTFTNFVTEPLKHVGKGIGEFFHALLAEMPVLYQLPVLIIIALLLLVFCYGAGTSIHHVNLFRRNDAYRAQLPAPEHQRPGYNHYIEGGDQRYYQPNQPRYIEGHRDPSNLRPETLCELDHGECRKPQVEQQSKQVVLENRSSGQNVLTPVTEDVCEWEKSKEVLEKRPLSQQPGKDIPEELSRESQVQQEKSLEEHFDRSTPNLHQKQCPGIPARSLPVEEVGSTQMQSSAKAREEARTCTTDFRNKNGKLEEQRPQETLKDQTGSIAASRPTSAVLDNANVQAESLLPNHNVNVDDIYTDPDLEGQSESLSFVILENQE
ncbi:chloride channel CLIC-like protein 1 [Gastrophryne carolinensis]